MAAAGETIWTFALEQRAGAIHATAPDHTRGLALPGPARQMLASGSGHPSFDSVIFVATTLGLVVVSPVMFAPGTLLPWPVFQAVPIHALAMEEGGDLFVLLEPAPGDSCEVWRVRALTEEPVLVGVVSPDARRLVPLSSTSVATVPALGRTLQILETATGNAAAVRLPDPENDASLGAGARDAATDQDWSLTPLSTRGPVLNPCRQPGAFLVAEQGRGRGLGLLCASTSGVRRGSQPWPGLTGVASADGWRVHRWPRHSLLREALLCGSRVVLNGVTDLLMLDLETREANAVAMPDHARALAADPTGLWLLAALATERRSTRLELLDSRTGSRRFAHALPHPITSVELGPASAGVERSAHQ